MPRTVAIVIAFRTQGEAIQAPGLTHGVKAASAPGQQFVDVSLVAHVEHEPVFRRIKYVMHGKRELDHPKIRPQMSAGLGEYEDQLFAYFLSQRL